MFLTIGATTEPGSPPATDLGYLLHKHPARVHTSETAYGPAWVFYPRADEQACTVALLLEVDPIALVRAHRGTPESFALGQYVNDRPYAASSLLAVALGRVFRTALAGRCTARPELVDVRFPLTVTVPALPARGGADLVRRLFGPLGWTTTARTVPLDPAHPQWGDARHVNLRLEGRHRLADALSHLYVLLPVLDGSKHYWVGTDEVDKLLRAGEGWLAGHPERDLVTRRYLAHRRELVLSAVGRLAEVDDDTPETLDNAVPDEAVGDEPASDEAASDEAASDGPAVPLAIRRRDAVLAELRSAGAHRVLDLGCGDGALLRGLLAEPAFTEIVGVDVSVRALEIAARRLHLDRLPDRVRERITLLQSALTYTDSRLTGYDAAVLMEVIEHLDPDRLPALEHAVFTAAAPATVIVTTPNVEHNVRYPGLAGGRLRHADHRFEWSRTQFRAWAEQVGRSHGYDVRFAAVGDDDPEVGPPTQLAVFSRIAREGSAA